MREKILYLTLEGDLKNNVLLSTRLLLEFISNSYGVFFLIFGMLCQVIAKTFLILCFCIVFNPLVLPLKAFRKEFL